MTSTLGAMKGVLVKLGQMASYVDEGLAPPVRRTLSRLQDSIPPMSPELAAQRHRRGTGPAARGMFAEWDPEPIAAASIGQVHRAITRDGRAVAVKVQYPGMAETMAADLDNVALLRRMLKITAPHQDVEALIAELRERVLRGAGLPPRGQPTSGCWPTTTTATPRFTSRPSSASCPPGGW